jgi:UrcA family protein
MLKALSVGGAVVVASALLLPTASLASTVGAADEDAVQTAKVSYADLDLATTRGSTVLQGRIKVAAAEVCGTARPVELKATGASRQCIIGAVASAQPAFERAIAEARHGSVTVTGASLIVTAPGL